MEGVGARLGRSSSRYGPTTVFNGQVRRWKKKWVHVVAPNSGNHQTAANGIANASSHLLLYKWTAITPSQNKDGNGDGNNSDNNVSKNDDSKNSDRDDAFVVEEPPKRKFKYIPIAVLEEQKNELSEQEEDEAKPTDVDSNATEVISKSDAFDEKPDINDIPMDENKSMENSHAEKQDLKDGDTETDSQRDEAVKDNDQCGQRDSQ